MRNEMITTRKKANYLTPCETVEEAVEEAVEEPVSKDVQSLLNAAKAKGDPDIERDAKLVAEMYQFCNRVKANSSVQFLPQIGRASCRERV